MDGVPTVKASFLYHKETVLGLFPIGKSGIVAVHAVLVLLLILKAF